MLADPVIPLARAVADRFARGLAQDADSLHCLTSTLGPLPAPALAERLGDPDDGEAATLRELLFFPGPDLAGELTLADAALVALTGRTGASREAARRELGTVTDVAGLLAALGLKQA